MLDLHDNLFRSLSDPTRRAIFERLCLGGEQNVLALTDFAGISQPAVSKHLAILKQAGLVSGRQDGRQTRYAANVEALAPLVDWTRTMSQFWDAKLDEFEGLLRRMDQ
ncbi:transcriptional regulator [Paracoccus suum]|uniref:Transcriptional regulator n=1 Tax=Paracoccus suum TaxID=2259340 RepID=A0A344PMA3_9RHOB|nr:metalloregulator ArsR/SmtB family transcription factor [Paracoccus suum]AXC50508.1 transcriptional regulator [Paracoccus suum]